MTAAPIGLGIVDDDAVWLIHTAGPVIDAMQCCAHCGQLLAVDCDLRWVDGLFLDRQYTAGAQVARLVDAVTAPYPIPPGRRLPTGHVLCTSPPKDTP